MVEYKATKINYGNIDLEAFKKSYERTLETDRILKEITEKSMRLKQGTLELVVDI